MQGRKLSAEHRRKISEAQRGRKLSPEWKEAQSRGQVERYRRAREQSVAEPDKKRCTKCKKMKRIPDDYIMKKRVLGDGTERRYAAGECKECNAKRSAAYRQKLRDEGVYSEKLREWNRNRDPEHRREYQREYQTIQRRKAGSKVRGPWKKYRDNGSGVRLDREPIANFVLDQMKERGFTLADLELATGIDESQLRRIINGKDGHKNVTLDLIDRILLGIDRQEMLYILYPDP